MHTSKCILRNVYLNMYIYKCILKNVYFLNYLCYHAESKITIHEIHSPYRSKHSLQITVSGLGHAKFIESSNT